MYSPLTGDVANARMADRHRYAAELGLESSARRSRPAPRRISWSGQSITAIAGAAIAGLRSAVARPRISPSVS